MDGWMEEEALVSISLISLLVGPTVEVFDNGAVRCHHNIRLYGRYHTIVEVAK